MTTWPWGIEAVRAWPAGYRRKIFTITRQDYCGGGNNPLLHAGYVANQRCAVILNVTQIKF